MVNERPLRTIWVKSSNDGDPKAELGERVSRGQGCVCPVHAPL